MKIFETQFLILSASYGFGKFDLVYFTPSDKKVYRVRWSVLRKDNRVMYYVLSRNLGLPLCCSQKFLRYLRTFVINNGFEVNYYPGRCNAFNKKKK